MATGDASDSVSHGYHRKAEGDGGAYNACRLAAAYEYCCTAAQKREHAGTDEFSKILFHCDLDFNVPLI